MIGAYSVDDGFFSSPTCIYDADGNMLLHVDNTKPVSLNPASTNEGRDTADLYRGADICSLDAIKEYLLKPSDFDISEDFSDEITIEDGGWYTISLSRTFSRENIDGTASASLHYKLDFYPIVSTYLNEKVCLASYNTSELHR